MKIEFHPPNDPDAVVATATWDGSRAVIDVIGGVDPADVGRVFRKTPVVLEDGAFLPAGSRGEVLLQPGSLEWFRAAAQVRAPEVGLVARVVPGVARGGFDPAAGYRPFDEAIERLMQAPD
jgi:hypothetical protein